MDAYRAASEGERQRMIFKLRRCTVEWVIIAVLVLYIAVT